MAGNSPTVAQLQRCRPRRAKCAGSSQLLTNWLGYRVIVFDDPAQRHDGAHLLRALRNPPAKLQVFAQAPLKTGCFSS
jgi:hypothetical protein